MDIMTSLRKAQRIGKSLVAIEAVDAELIASLYEKHAPKSITEPSEPGVRKKGAAVRVATWDVVRGFSVMGEKRFKLEGLHNEPMLPNMLKVFSEKSQRGDVLFCLDPAPWLANPEVAQILRLARPMPGMVVMVGHVTEILERSHLDDYFLMLSDDAFDLEVADALVTNYAVDTGIDPAGVAPKLMGLSPENAMCALEMATWKNDAGGLDLDLEALASRQRERINGTLGLSLFQSDGGFDSLVGFDRLKELCSVVFEGKRPPGAVVWLDELEKQIAGTNDSSGVTQDQIGCLLGWMEDHKAEGIILVGHSGTAKSHFAKSLAMEFDVDGVRMDLGGTKGNLVGDSEARIRDALAAVGSLTDRTFWVATSNWLENVPQELRRRFKFGTWFVDMPTEEERQQIWAMHCEQNELSAMDVPPALMARLLTGSEIATVCDLAGRSGLPLESAAEFIAPIAEGQGQEKIMSLRSLAQRTYLDVSSGGKYQGVK